MKPPFDRAKAEKFARAWLSAWNDRDIDRILAQMKAHAIGVMDHDIGDHPTARTGVVKPPTMEERRQVHRVKHPHA